MSKIIDLGNDILTIDWRRLDSEDVSDLVETFQEEHDQYEVVLTIDEFRNNGFDDSQICEIMQCLIIQTYFSMI